MKIFSHNTLKRLSSILLAVSVLCCSLSVWINTSAAIGEVTVVNDGSDATTVTTFSSFDVSVVDDISPDGAALSIGSTQKDGAGVIFYNFQNADANKLKDMEGFSVWVKVGNSSDFCLMPNFNAESRRFIGKITAYNIYTGETLEADSDRIILPKGFEGYVVFDLTSCRVKYTWGTTPNYSWSEFVAAEGINAFAPYTFHAHLNEHPIIIDSFAFVADYNSYMSHLKSQLLSTMKPYSDTTPGMVKNGTRINLFAEDNTVIYYTLDGSEPTEASTKYELLDLGDGNEPVSPIVLTQTTTVKAIAVKNGNPSKVAVLNYEVEPPYTGPKNIIINDGSGEGVNIVSGANEKFTTSYVDSVSPEGKSIKVEFNKPTEEYNLAYCNFKVKNEGIEQLHNIETLSYWIKVPDLEKPINLSLHLNNEGYSFSGKIYALNTKENTVQIARDSVELDNFEGLVFYILEGNCVKENNGAATVTWKEFIKKNGLNTVLMNNNKVKDESATNVEYYIDSFQIHYDLEAVLEEYEIEKLILANVPNFQIVNSGEDENLAISNNEEKCTVTIVDGISPEGNAYSIQASVNSGSAVLDFDLEQIDPEILSLKEALAVWIRVPQGITYRFSPNINGYGFSFIGTISTYNTLTGELETFNDVNSVTLSDFEGYVFLHLKDCGVNKQWTGKKPYTWDEFVVEKNGVNKLVVFVLNDQIVKDSVYLDSFSFVSSLDKFVEELKAQPLRTIPPYSDAISGPQPQFTRINLLAQDGADIYYTLDGSIPTIKSPKYEMIDFGNGSGFVSPIVIDNDIVIKAIAVKNGIVSAVSTLEYILELPYDGPKDIIINDGSGEGINTVGWANEKLTTSYVDGISPDSKAIKVEFNNPKDQYPSTFYNIKVKNEGIEQLHNIEALSYWVKVPDLGDGKNKFVTFRLHPNDPGNNLNGQIYAIDTRNKTVKMAKDTISLNDFEGVVIYVIEGENIRTGYGASTTNWYSFSKQNGLDIMWICNLKEKDETFDKVEYYIDNFQIHYDIDELFEKYDLAGLLAKYDVGSAENTNMTVANDCSGYKINGGISEISDNLTLEASNYSPDDRNLKINFTKSDATIGLPNFSTDESNMIADGITFWVDTKDAKTDIELKFKVNELGGAGKEEIFEYSERRWYYLIDRDGVISKEFGKFILPENFRGWIVLPKESLLYVSEASTFDNGVLDCDKLGTFTVTFKNDDNRLSGKSIYFDDMSFYIDFPTLVRSRARAWKSHTLY